jgi:hypothetical protein
LKKEELRVGLKAEKRLSQRFAGGTKQVNSAIKKLNRLKIVVAGRN